MLVTCSTFSCYNQHQKKHCQWKGEPLYMDPIINNWTVQQLSIKIIYNCTISIQQIRIKLSADNLAQNIQKKAYFLFVINLITRSKKICRLGRSLKRCETIQMLRFIILGRMHTLCLEIINITPDLPFLNIHNPFTNERISVHVYLDKHSRITLLNQLATCLRAWLQQPQRNVS